MVLHKSTRLAVVCFWILICRWCWHILAEWGCLLSWSRETCLLSLVFGSLAGEIREHSSLIHLVLCDGWKLGALHHKTKHNFVSTGAFIMKFILAGGLGCFQSMDFCLDSFIKQLMISSLVIKFSKKYLLFLHSVTNHVCGCVVAFFILVLCSFLQEWSFWLKICSLNRGCTFFSGQSVCVC